MSTFAVFGMTQAAALADARKKTPTTRVNKKVQGGVEPIPMDEWLAAVDAAVLATLESTRTRQLSPLYDAPQYAQQFIDLARRTDKCRDMHIRARCVLTDAQGKPIIDPKSKTPKYGFTDWDPRKTTAA